MIKFKLELDKKLKVSKMTFNSVVFSKEEVWLEPVVNQILRPLVFSEDDEESAFPRMDGDEQKDVRPGVLHRRQRRQGHWTSAVLK